MLRSPKSLLIGIATFVFFSFLSYYRSHPTVALEQTTATRGQASIKTGITADEDQTPKNTTTDVKSRKSSAVVPQRVRDGTKDVYNETLGFEKTFTINLPERVDKLDQFSLLSSVTGFTFDVIEGVRGEKISNKSLPTLEGVPSSDNPDKASVLGCWRAHMNFAQRIVKDRLSSAIVIEDDSDWDTHLKSQLELIAQGSRFISNTDESATTHSPYGDDWDLIWLGHCATGIGSDIDRRFVIENDATVPPGSRRVNYGAPNMEEEGYDDTTRLVFQASSGVCTYSYALSYRGARTVLHELNRASHMDPIDFSLAWLCSAKIKCVGVFPALFGSFRTVGVEGRDSDMTTADRRTAERDKAFTDNIVHSVALNLERLLKDPEAKPERQWPDDPVVEGEWMVRGVEGASKERERKEKEMEEAEKSERKVSEEERKKAGREKAQGEREKAQRAKELAEHTENEDETDTAEQAEDEQKKEMPEQTGNKNMKEIRERKKNERHRKLAHRLEDREEKESAEQLEDREESQKGSRRSHTPGLLRQDAE